MQMREAVFFSSKNTASYNTSDGSKGYHIYVKEELEEYTPLFTTEPGPHFLTVYHIYVSRIIKGVRQEPHHKGRDYKIEDCESTLQFWHIDTDHGWTPEEEEDTVLI